MVSLSVPVRRRSPRILTFPALLATLVIPCARLDAQRPAGGSIRVSTDHWANEYVRRLRDRGYLAGLNPLVQPWRASDIARELGRLDPDTMPQPARDWVRLLSEEFGWRSDLRRTGPRGGAVVTGGARTSTSRRLDPVRPVGDAGLWPRYQAGGWFETGPVAAEARLLGDLYFLDDPDGLDPEQSRGARSDFAYVAADFPVASIELGRFARNWSIAGTHGLMVSDDPTPYPQVGLDIHVWRLTLRSFMGELDTLIGQKRYVAAHRIDYETANFVASFGEVNLYAPASGAPSLRWLNPVESFFFEGDNQPLDATNNLVLDLQLWARVGDVSFHAEGALDDFDLSPPAGVDPAPTRYAFRLGAQWQPGNRRVSVQGRYEQVSSYAYRTSRVIDGYTFLGRGIGESHADYDRLALGVEWVPPVRGLILDVGGVLQRQGEGDLKTPFGDYNTFRASPALFLGVRETTLRGALSGRYQPIRFAWLAWDLGYNWIRNRNHVQDAHENLFSAVAELGVRLDLPLRREQ